MNNKHIVKLSGQVMIIERCLERALTLLPEDSSARYYILDALHLCPSLIDGVTALESSQPTIEETYKERGL